MQTINMDRSGEPTPIIVDPKAGPEQPYHFYVTCCYGYAKGRTYEQAIDKLIDGVVGRGFAARRRAMGQPIQTWTALVHHPISYSYRISCYKPCVTAIEWIASETI